MKISELSLKGFSRNLMYTMIFGIASYFMGMLKFEIPGLEGASSDFREIPMIISIFYFSNPLYTIGISFITAFGTPPGGSFISTFLMHSVSLIIIWTIYYKIRKIGFSYIYLGISCMFLTLIYYFVFLIPLMIVTNYAVGLNTEKNFIEFYFETIYIIRFEIIATSIITALYLVQHKARLAIKKHNETLESLVKERTNELAQANESLNEKNAELIAQHEELYTTLEVLKNTQSLLIQSERMASLGTLTAGIAHEINNPLNFINGGVYIIDDIFHSINKNLAENLKDDCNNGLEMIRQGFERVNKIVQSLTAISSDSKSLLKLTEINSVIDNTLLFLNFKISENIKIIKEYQLEDKVPVFTDKIHQVFVNILDNAIHEVSQKQEAKKEIIIATNRINNKACIKIFNDGPPIEEDLLKKIFDPFFTTKDPGKGTGLGLFIAYSMIMDHKGTIHAQNTKKGVCFTIEIPIAFPSKNSGN
jgi:signal transduction histidine kinase